MPSRETAKVAEILEGDKRVEQSSKGHAVTIRLDTEIDVSRGCVLERGTSSVQVRCLQLLSFGWMTAVWSQAGISG